MYALNPVCYHSLPKISVQDTNFFPEYSDHRCCHLLRNLDVYTFWGPRTSNSYSTICTAMTRRMVPRISYPPCMSVESVGTGSLELKSSFALQRQREPFLLHRMPQAVLSGRLSRAGICYRHHIMSLVFSLWSFLSTYVRRQLCTSSGNCYLHFILDRKGDI